PVSLWPCARIGSSSTNPRNPSHFVATSRPGKLAASPAFLRLGPMFMFTLVSAAEGRQATWISTAIRESIWVSPIVESIHVVTIALFLGLTAAMDARLVGAAPRGAPGRAPQGGAAR